VLSTDLLRTYVNSFNATDDELCVQHIPNSATYYFLAANIPLFECPDPDIERTYYFRWWTYRKHFKETPDGFVITEFLPDVPWAGKYNAIGCAAGHHFYEGRWLRDQRYLDDYAVFWLRKGGAIRTYSFWIADALWGRHLARPNAAFLIDLLDDLIANYRGWERERLYKDGMFWQYDGNDGGEVSIGGHGRRPTINSYMYGDANAISRMAWLAGRLGVSSEYANKAARLKALVLEKLWDPDARFFKTLPREEDMPKGDAPKLVDVRELYGYTPWYFHLPDPGYAEAWAQLMDPKGFYAPFGPTTAEQRHPGFKVSYEGHECQWNGPSWPYATSITLRAMANVLRDHEQDTIDRDDYFDILSIYTRSHKLVREDGTTVPWIDENLDPFTGEWLARTLLRRRGQGPEERGKDYNHSEYCDLVITGPVGLVPRDDDVVEVDPLLPEGMWDWFCLDRVPYHDRSLTIVWDRTGEKYGLGTGLRVLADGVAVAHSERLERVTGRL